MHVWWVGIGILCIEYVNDDVRTYFDPITRDENCLRNLGIRPILGPSEQPTKGTEKIGMFMTEQLKELFMDRLQFPNSVLLSGVGLFLRQWTTFDLTKIPFAKTVSRH
jgi:hypothetical protein